MKYLTQVFTYNFCTNVDLLLYNVVLMLNFIKRARTKITKRGYTA